MWVILPALEELRLNTSISDYYDMKQMQHFLRGSGCVIFGACLLCAPAFGAKKNPTSKLYVADLDGIAEIDTGERIEELSKRSVHNAQGTVIVTMADSSNAMVFSNGTGIYFAPDTRVEVKRFSQEPFSPNRSDLETEPSMSQTFGFIPRGAVGLCVPKLVAGSSMVYQTPQGAMNVRGRKVVIETDGFETKISMVEGESTVRGDEATGGGETIKGGEQAIIRRLPGRKATIEIQAIPEEEREAIDDKVTLACNARKTVYFDVAEKKELTAPEGSEVTETGTESESDEESENPELSAGNGEGWAAIFDESDDETVDDIVVVVVTPVEPPQEVVEVSAARILPRG